MSDSGQVCGCDECAVHGQDNSTSSESSLSSELFSSRKPRHIRPRAELRKQEEYYEDEYQHEYYNPRRMKTDRYDPGVSHFNSMITPVTGLVSEHSEVQGMVEFRMRRKNKTVTLQWEPFSGSMAASGISALTVNQTIANTPPYQISLPIHMSYKGVNRLTYMTINPNAKTSNIKIYINSDGSSNDINAGDAFSVSGGVVTWIVD